MQQFLSIEDRQQPEHLAISSLLEIDLKEDGHQQTWAEHKKSVHFGSNSKVSQTIRPHQAKSNPRLRHTSKRYEQETSLRSNYNPEMMEPNDFQLNFTDESKQPQEQTNQRQLKEKKFNEGEFWSSKVNWTSSAIKPEMRSQPKLSKKFSFGNEANSRHSRRASSRYDSDEKTRQEEYKTNLIYSILSGEAEALKLKQLEQRNKSTTNRSSESSFTPMATKKQSRTQNNQKAVVYNCNLTKNVQESMRKTLKKITARNFQDGFVQPHTPLNKQSELQRAALVRLMLQNMEIAREKPSTDGRSQKKEVKKEGKHHQIIQDMMQPFMQHIKQAKKKSNVLNLNLQAQKVYKGRTVNKWNGRRLIQVVKVH